MNKIIKLPEEIQKRICAGEVIVSPYNVIKELIENSIDAGSTVIRIKLSKDNLNIEVHDNGCGIEKSDFDNLASPHHTSKFDESLHFNNYYGFRGEALSSINVVSHLIIKSKTKSSELGYIKNYKDGSLKSVSMNNGTSVYIKNLFYNNKIRENIYIKKIPIFNKIHDLVKCYAVKNSEIQFLFNDVCIDMIKQDRKKSLEEVLEISSDRLKGSKDISSEEIIEYEKQMMKIGYQENPNEDKNFRDYLEKIIRNFGYSSSYKEPNKISHISSVFNVHNLRHFSNDFITFAFSPSSVNFNNLKLIVFINGRLVINHSIKVFITRKYSNILPKGRYPFIYIEMNIPVQHIDVNVHPSKKEVLIEYEDLILEIIDLILETGLNDNRHIQSKDTPLKSFSIQDNIIYRVQDSLKECIRTTNKIDYKLLSINKLRSQIREIDGTFLSNLVYVGIVDDEESADKSYLLVQYNQYLMKVNTSKLRPILIYHFFLYNFGNFQFKKVNIRICKKTKYKKMLNEYFKIEIEDFYIKSIPLIGEYYNDNGSDWDTFIINGSTEEEVFREVFSNLIFIYRNLVFDKNIFSLLKKDVKCTKEVLECFVILKSLKDLYKCFERC
jgi:DNA mismatch repair protein MLH1